jgi:N-acetyl-anhydromuramoyl-L-alanine amidase
MVAINPGEFRNMIISDHFLNTAIQIASPNFDSRPDADDISLLVIHSISLPPGEFGGEYIDQLFTNCLIPDYHPYFKEIYQLRVSAHLLIRRDGELHQYVGFDQRAWHAGVSRYDGRENCNDFSIGIELEGAVTCGFTDIQYTRLASTVRVLLANYPRLHRRRIVGHSDIAPGRKIDPGPLFDWERFLSLID